MTNSLGSHFRSLSLALGIGLKEEVCSFTSPLSYCPGIVTNDLSLLLSFGLLANVGSKFLSDSCLDRRYSPPNLIANFYLFSPFHRLDLGDGCLASIRFQALQIFPSLGSCFVKILIVIKLGPARRFDRSTR